MSTMLDAGTSSEPSGFHVRAHLHARRAISLMGYWACKSTEKLKNRKTEFSREIQEEILHMDSVFQFFCFVAE